MTALRKKPVITMGRDATLAAAAMIFLSIPSRGQADFYQNRTMNLITPHSVGGGYDVYARALASFLEKRIPGLSVVVRNVTGGGGIVGRNQIMMARADGLTLGLISGGGSLLTQLTGMEGVMYDVSAMSILGRVDTDASMLAAGSRSGIRTFADLRKFSGPVKTAVSGVGSDDFYAAHVIGEALGLNLKVIAGYRGALQGAMAAVQGEVNAVLTDGNTLRPLLERGDLLPIWQVSEESRFQGVPTAVELAESYATPAGRELVRAITNAWTTGRIIVGPPAIPVARLEYLRAAFAAVMADVEFAARLEKLGRPLSPLSSGELTKLIRAVMDCRDSLSPVLERHLNK